MGTQVRGAALASNGKRRLFKGSNREKEPAIWGVEGSFQVEGTVVQKPGTGTCFRWMMAKKRAWTREEEQPWGLREDRDTSCGLWCGVWNLSVDSFLNERAIIEWLLGGEWYDPMYAVKRCPWTSVPGVADSGAPQTHTLKFSTHLWSLSVLYLSGLQFSYLYNLISDHLCITGL